MLASGALARVVAHFVLRPGAALHFRALQRATGVSSRSLQQELARLEELGMVRGERAGRLVRYRAVDDHPRWRVLREMVRAFAAPAELLRAVVLGAPGVEAAFLYGSFAREGAVDEGSDVDVMVVGNVDEPETRFALGEGALEAAALLGREVNLTRYTPERLAARRARGGRFLRSVLEGPKEWLVGDERVLEASAA